MIFGTNVLKEEIRYQRKLSVAPPSLPINPPSFLRSPLLPIPPAPLSPLPSFPCTLPLHLLPPLSTRSLLSFFLPTTPSLKL
ncbi:hypothetical protein BT96DRAFT_1025570 [Gymnopus androsaceus JB14]|uniref:Uncharacterized protein n=1 Tax=Gymnopus androsaceus JB14 TaxID=1447944 RepID=A0A6A4GSH0_9AGAR|nr:hypothetical protein BT96DRAFT_1025570 [Gymnopus androsaceus JB14]